MNQRIDETRLQRLVDGALNEYERQEFLVGLEGQPELWREVALAFVEEQIWQREIAGLQHGDEQRRPAEENIPAGGRRVSPGLPAASRRDAAAGRRSWVTVLALSVSLFAMLAAGFQLGGWRSRSQNVAAPVVEQLGGDDSRTGTRSVDSPDSETPGSSWRGADNLASDYRIVWPHEEGQVVEMPLIEESQFDTNSWEHGDPMIVEELNKRLRRRGYRADWQTEYLTGRLDDGRQLVVPYRTVSLRYDAQ
jgi:hypothetical protein